MGLRITLLEESASSDGLLLSDSVRLGMESVQQKTFKVVFLFWEKITHHSELMNNFLLLIYEGFSI